MLRADELREGLRSTYALELIAGDATVVLGVQSPELNEIGDIPLERQLFNVFVVRDGRIASIRDYATRGEALAGVGVAAPAWS